MITVIDNVLEEKHLESFKDVINSEWFPWNIIGNSAYHDDEELLKQSVLNYSFFHMCLNDSKPTSSYFNEPALIELSNKIQDSFRLNKDYYNLFRMRLGMTTSIGKPHQNTPHVDWDMPHKSILFYLNDSDGDTHFYDKENNVIKTVAPKENRAVLFDGLIPHASSKPVKFYRRIVLNINLLEKI